jgi:hypothetical protein
MKRLMLVLLAVGLVFGCASTQEKIAKQAAQEVVVERNTDRKDRPAWVREGFKEDNETLYFSGGIDRGQDLAISIRQAKAEAMKNMAESVVVKIRQEFTEMAEGDNQNGDIARWVSDGIAWAVENFYVTGAKLKNVYYERVYSPVQGNLSYTAFVLLEVSKADYLRSRQDALQRLAGYFNSKKQYEAEKRAKELLEKLLKEEAI